MKHDDEWISSDSEYFVYTPSATALATFFYPISVGCFYVLPGYNVNRINYGTYLLMYVESGQLTIEFENKKEIVSSGNFVLLDCYEPHAYYANCKGEILWCHFDGPMARAFYDLIISQRGHIFSFDTPYPVYTGMKAVYETFSSKAVIKEALLSKQLTDIFTGILTYTSKKNEGDHNRDTIEETVTYINEHFAENISIQELSERAMFSQSHFIRVFKKATSFTPHEYIIHTRINNAKYMLKNTNQSLKNIGFSSGFASESTFSSSFKKYVGQTPVEYRNSNI